MGTTLSVTVSSSDRALGIAAIDSAFSAVLGVDEVLNDWNAESQLGRFNRSEPGRPDHLTRELFGYLEHVAQWSRTTEGAFDPAIGAFTDAWDSRGQGRHPSDDALAVAAKDAGIARYSFDPRAFAVQRPTERSWIDAGGFGKGAALTAAREALLRQQVQSGILNFGGQILVYGDTSLAVDVADPIRRDRPVAQVSLRGASISTTAQSERYIEVDGRRFGHVIDPRTGHPVPAWGSVTVIHHDAMVADILSTALFVMGPVDGVRWANHQGIAALFLVTSPSGLAQRSSRSMQKFLLPSPVHIQGD